jgi:hypothetical protein
MTGELVLEVVESPDPVDGGTDPRVQLAVNGDFVGLEKLPLIGISSNHDTAYMFANPGEIDAFTSPGSGIVQKVDCGGVFFYNVGGAKKTGFAENDAYLPTMDDVKEELRNSRPKSTLVTLPLSFHPSGHIRPEIIHGLAEFREPVKDIPVVTGDPSAVALLMADYHSVSQRVQVILLAEIGCQLHGLLVHRLKIAGILQAVLADFKGNVGIICTAVLSSATVPASPVPGQGLDRTHRSVCKEAYKGVGALFQSGPVPIIPVLIPTNYIISGHIAGHRGVISPRRVYHYSQRPDGPPGLVTVVLGQILFS